VAKITPFNEQDVEQEEIEEGTFYYRVRRWRSSLIYTPSQSCTSMNMIGKNKRSQCVAFSIDHRGQADLSILLEWLATMHYLQKGL